MKDRVILHADINNFYASAAQLFNPELEGKPFVICGNPDKRHGVVLAKNFLAKKDGIVTGETLIEARRKSPDLFAVPPDFKKYSELSKRVIKIYMEYTPIIESFGLDECWLDVSSSINLFGNGIDIAEKIRERIKSEIGITVSIGVSFTKVFAKLGSDMKKPDAITVIDRNNFKKKVWGLSASELLYIGRNSAVKLAEMSLKTIGDVANADRQLLYKTFGKNGLKLHDMANGNDREEVDANQSKHIPESVSTGSTTEKDITDIENAKSLIYSLGDAVSFRLRQHSLAAFGVMICIRDNGLNYFSKQFKLPAPTSDAKIISDKALDLLTEIYNFRKGSALRLITVGTYDLVSGEELYQSSFFDLTDERDLTINERLDNLRRKYGYGILKRAVEINPDFSCDSREAEDGYVPFDRRGIED